MQENKRANPSCEQQSFWFMYLYSTYILAISEFMFFYILCIFFVVDYTNCVVFHSYVCISFFSLSLSLARSTFDTAGFSDPYCMLGIQPGGTPISPLPPPMTPRTLSDVSVGFDNNLDSPHGQDKLRKHHSFRLSFKRKDGRREHRDSLNGPVPAKFIRATSIKSHTLSPKWHEKFKLYVF